MSNKLDLKGKSILFFSVQTFNLENEIKNKLEQAGATVVYYDERPANNNFTKGIIRLKRSLYQNKINSYYTKILTDTKDKIIDFLFVNRGEVVPSFFLEQFSLVHPACKKIFYTWDSFTNHAHPTTILHFFDKRFTFDPEDARKYHIGFRPLFFLDKYKSIKESKSTNYTYDILFLGTAHSDRYIISNKIAKWGANNNLTSFCYYYMHGRIVYFYKRLFEKSFKEFDYNKLSFKSLNGDQIIELYKQSKVILDINHPGQKGLTMRTFEAIGAGKKLITTNPEIKNYPFYNKTNFLVIDRKDIKLNKDFFVDDYANISTDLYDKCSIDGWLNDIFLNEEDNLNFILKI